MLLHHCSLTRSHILSRKWLKEYLHHFSFRSKSPPEACSAALLERQRYLRHISGGGWQREVKGNERRQKEGRRRWGNRGYKIPSWLLEKMMRSPENGQSREGAAFLHEDSSNLPHPVHTPGMEATLSLITRITNPSPLGSSRRRSPHVTFPPLQLTPPPPRLPHAPPSHQCRGRNGWLLLSADSGRMDTK